VTGPDSGPPVEVSAVAEGEDARVRFRRLRYGSAGHLARLRVTGGALAEVVHSPDRRSVSVLWRDRNGRLECRFAYGGYGEFDAGGVLDQRLVEYVFLEADGCSITAVVPHANPMRAILPLRVRVESSHLPAMLTAPGGISVAIESTEQAVPFALPADAENALIEGDFEVEILTSDGTSFACLIGVDEDGTPVAATGFVRDAGS
jgi:hypothetical protein